MDVTLDAVAGSARFQHSPAPYVLLDRRLRIRSVNSAYLLATGRTAEELTGMDVFEAFPDNPADPGADGVAQLTASCERVLREGRAHDMLLQRYDIPSPASATGFVDRVWSPVNSPVADAAGRTAGILHHVEDLTGVHRLAGGEPRPPQPTGAIPMLRTRLHDIAALAAHTRVEQLTLAAQGDRLADALVKVVASAGLTDPAPAQARREELWRGIVGHARRPGWRSWAHALCDTALRTIPGVHGASLSVHTADGIHYLLGATNRWAEQADELHLTVGQGPALTAYTAGLPVLVSDLTAQHPRWPGYTSAATGHGVAAVHAFPVRMQHVPVATLTLYSRAPGPLTTRATTDAALLAGLATPVVTDDLDGVFADALSDTPAPRGPATDIAVASGILSARHRLSVDDALVRLRAAAFTRGIPLAGLAADIIAGRTTLD